MRTRTCLAILLAALALSGCSTSTQQSATPAAQPQAAAAADSAVLQPIDGPGIVALAADGHARATLVNVWATWCMPCREEFPELLEAARAHTNDGVRLVLVSTDFDEQLPDVRLFLAKHGVSGTSYVKHGKDQPFIDAIDKKWTGTIPCTIVYDSTGQRVAFWEGRADRARFEAAIQKALGAAPHTTGENPS